MSVMQGGCARAALHGLGLSIGCVPLRLNIAEDALHRAASGRYDDGNDGPVHGFPFVANFNSPYTVVYTTNTQVHAVSFNVATNAFTKLWTTAIFSAPNLTSCAGRSCTLSAPVVSFTQSMVYAGGSDGMLYELNLATGAISKGVVVDTFYPAIVGDPALDEINEQIFVSTLTNDQRVYSFAIPF